MSKEQRERGYRDGRAYADSVSKDNVFEGIVRGFSDAIVSPKQSDAEDYERGFREGREDGRRSHRK
jgi:hypothetical protein